MADHIRGAAQSGGAPTYVQQAAGTTPAITDPTSVHEALTASTEANATSIANLDAKNRRMYKHIPAEMRRDYLEDEAEQSRVDANQDAVIEDHVRRLAGTPETYGHIAGTSDNAIYRDSGELVHDRVIKIDAGRICIDTAGANELGVSMPGDGLAMGLVGNDPSKPTGRLNVKPATTSTIGGVKVGDNIAVADDGTISTHAPYTLPVATTDTLGGVKASTSVTVAKDGAIKVNPDIFSDGLTATDAQVSVDTGFVANAIAGDGLKVVNDGLAINCGSGLIINDDKIQYESPILSWTATLPDGTFTISDGASIDSAICITSKGSTYLFKVVVNFITSAAFTTGTKITIKLSGYNIIMCCLGACSVGDVTLSDTEFTVTFKQDVAANTDVKVVVV